MGVTVEFKDVGISKMTWSKTLPMLNAEKLIKAIREQRAFASDDVKVELNTDFKSGRITACGVPNVGTFRILDPVETSIDVASLEELQ